MSECRSTFSIVIPQIEVGDKIFCASWYSSAGSSYDGGGHLYNSWHDKYCTGEGDTCEAAADDARAIGLRWLETTKDEMEQALAKLPAHIKLLQAKIKELEAQR